MYNSIFLFVFVLFCFFWPGYNRANTDIAWPSRQNFIWSTYCFTKNKFLSNVFTFLSSYMHNSSRISQQTEKMNCIKGTVKEVIKVLMKHLHTIVSMGS